MRQKKSKVEGPSVDSFDDDFYDSLFTDDKKKKEFVRTSSGIVPSHSLNVDPVNLNELKASRLGEPSKLAERSSSSKIKQISNHEVKNVARGAGGNLNEMFKNAHKNKRVRYHLIFGLISRHYNSRSSHCRYYVCSVEHQLLHTRAKERMA